MAVTRCICFDVTFAELKRIADEINGGLLEMHRATGCGARCGLCLPYIQAMIQTGRSTFPVMWTADFQALGINPGYIARLERRLREAESSPAAQATLSAG